MKEPFEIQTDLITDIGRARSRNQDNLGICEPTDPAILSNSGRLYIVADGAGGVGGAIAGKIASRYAVSKVKAIYFRSAGSTAPVGERLRSAMLAANDAIRAHVERPRRTRQMATTMVAMVIRRGMLTVANVGDSRAYLMRENTLRQITQDHSLVAGLLADGIITPEEAIHHPQRNVILYSLGSAPHEPRIDIFEIKLQPDDLILACTDGLTRYTDPDKLLPLLTEGPPEGAARRLIDFANESGGADNVTVALLRIKKRALPRWIWWLLLFFGIGLIALSGFAGLALAGWKLWGS